MDRRLSEGAKTLMRGKSELADGRPGEAKLILSNLLTRPSGRAPPPGRPAGPGADLLARADAAVDARRLMPRGGRTAERDRERYRRFRRVEG